MTWWRRLALLCIVCAVITSILWLMLDNYESSSPASPQVRKALRGENSEVNVLEGKSAGRIVPEVIALEASTEVAQNASVEDITVVVRDAQSLVPVANAVVAAKGSGDDWVSARSTATGLASLRVGPLMDGCVELRVRSEDYVGRELRMSTMRELLDVRLQPGGEARVRVQWSGSDEPVANARVAVKEHVDNPELEVQLTDSAGPARFTQVPKGVPVWFLVQDCPRREQMIAAEWNSLDMELVLKIEEGTLVQFEVRDETTSLPISEAAVVPLSIPASGALTDAAGQTALYLRPDLLGGRQHTRVGIYANDYATCEARIDLAEHSARQPVTVSLRPASRVQVMVQSSIGQPVAGAAVRIVHDRHAELMARFAYSSSTKVSPAIPQFRETIPDRRLHGTTAPDGSCVFECLPSDLRFWYVRVQHPAYGEIRSSLMSAYLKRANPVLVRLSFPEHLGTGSIDGDLLVDGVRMRGEISWSCNGIVESAVTTRDGHFRLECVTAGDVTFRARPQTAGGQSIKEFCSPLDTVVQVRANTTTKVTVSLTSERRIIKGSVALASGNMPCAAAITAEGTQTKRLWTSSSDCEGVFEIWVPTAEAVRLTAKLGAEETGNGVVTLSNSIDLLLQ
jgi:hypothetical protein